MVFMRKLHVSLVCYIGPKQLKYSSLILIVTITNGFTRKSIYRIKNRREQFQPFKTLITHATYKKCFTSVVTGFGASVTEMQRKIIPY